MNETRTTPAGMRVRTIPATVRRFSPATPLHKKLRVAAYARVSTDDEEQQTSYEAQVDYYTRLIQNNPDWEFVEVYADEGISGTSTKRRVSFNRMIEDAMAGKIDRIITKSVSRFARNTVDTLTTIRALKEKGIGVMFEKENIDTLDGKGELLITIMSSLAQEESRSISDNVTWGWRKRLADGKVSVAYSRFLGYEKGKDGKMQIVEKEAAIVRRIYALFLDGQTPSSIAAILTKEHIATPSGKETWQPSTVHSILTNEKYKGDSLQQKTFTVDFLNKKIKANEGEVPQYYVENSHPAIVSAEVFDLAQAEMARRKRAGRQTSAVSVFSSRIICGECGGIFGSKVWHSNSPYRCTIWRCNKKYSKSQRNGTHRAQCATPHLREEEIKAAFVEAVNKLIGNKEEILSAYDEIIEGLTDTAALQAETERLQAERSILYQQMEQLVRGNAAAAQDQEEYNHRYQALIAQDESIQKKLERAQGRMAEKAEKKLRLEAFMKELRQAERLVKFDEKLFVGTVDTITVYGDKRMVFRFKDGTEI